MGKYFSKFPVIEYQGKIAKNILARPKVMTDLDSGKTPYYTYKVPAGKYYDQISSEYYGNHDFTWLMYLANQVVDPYYDVYLNDEDFNQFIIKKYGSIAFAQSVYAYWENSYKSDTREISFIQYDSLPPQQKRFWTPVVTNVYTSPTAYRRKQLDEKVSTNRVVTVSSNQSSQYTINDEFITQDINGNPAGGIVKAISGNNITLNHVFSVIVNGNEYSELINQISAFDNIPAIEAQYWTPVTLLEMEERANLERQDIRMVDKSLTYVVEKDLKKVMNE